MYNSRSQNTIFVVVVECVCLCMVFAYATYICATYKVLFAFTPYGKYVVESCRDRAEQEDQPQIGLMIAQRIYFVYEELSKLNTLGVI